MDIFAFVVLGLILVIAVYFGLTYNGLVQVKHNVAKAWPTSMSSSSSATTSCRSSSRPASSTAASSRRRCRR